MANIVAFNPTQVPAFVQAGGNSALSQALAGSGSFGKRISIKGGVFRLYESGKEVAAIDERYLDVVICAAAGKISRMYYEGEFKEDVVTPPTCWSSDGTVPDEAVAHKQSSNCADCPQNVKGSAPQGDMRACRFNQRLAVVLANDIDGSVMQLQLPAQSIFGKGEGESRPLQAYARFLAANKISPDQVVTRMRFDTSVATPKLFFAPQRWLTEQEYGTVIEQGKSDDAVQAITMTVFQVDTGEEPVPEISLPGKKPKLAPTSEAPATEPKLRGKTITAPPVAPKAALDKLVAEWAGQTDDEEN